jgi:protein-arginine kinase activator protein McsA
MEISINIVNSRRYQICKLSMSSMVTKKLGCSTCILLYKHPHPNITNIQYPTNFHTIQTKHQDCTPSFEQKKTNLLNYVLEIMLHLTIL